MPPSALRLEVCELWNRSRNGEEDMFKLASQKRNPGLTRVPTRTITTLLVITLAAVAAYAAINYKSGPTFSISTFDLITTGELSGLGSTAQVLVDAEGTANGSCTNKGGTTVPVHAATVDAAGSATLHPDSNGRSNFSVTASPVANPNPCPNGNWTFNIEQVTYTSATVSVTAGSQSLVNTYQLTNCTETDPAVPVACTRTP